MLPCRNKSKDVFLVTFNGLKSARSGLDSIFDVFHSRFADEFAELCVPGSGPQPVAIALLEHTNDGLDDQPAVLECVVLPGIVCPLQPIELAVSDERADAVIPEPSA